jgi:hypothetical protein
MKFTSAVFLFCFVFHQVLPQQKQYILYKSNIIHLGTLFQCRSGALTSQDFVSDILVGLMRGSEKVLDRGSLQWHNHHTK